MAKERPPKPVEAEILDPDDCVEIEGALAAIKQPSILAADKPKKPLEMFTRTTTTWLNLFTAANSGEYSHTFELVDDLPIYFYGRRQPGVEVHAIEREFLSRKRRLKVSILPAIVKEGKDSHTPFEPPSGQYRRRFPGEREELVLEAIKYLASQKGVLLDGDVGVPFSLSELERLLADANHSFRQDEIKEALRTLSRTKIVLQDSAGLVVFEESPVKSLVISRQGTRDLCVVQLSSIYTEAIRKLEYRAYNFIVAARYQSIVARKLHRHMSHHFTQADETTPYVSNASAILILAGLSTEEKPNKWAKRVQEGANEVQHNGYVSQYTFEPVKSAGRIVDYKFSIYASKRFIDEIIEENTRKKRLEIKLRIAGAD